MSILYSIILANLAISMISLVGVLFLKKASREHLLYYFVSFAAGVMLTTAFTDLLPDAQMAAKGLNIFLPTLAGIIIFFFIERFVLWFHHHDGSHNLKPSVILVILGDGFHNFFDGIAIAATFMTNPALGITTALAIAAHEIPQEIADFSILVYGGMTKTKALFFNFLSALTAVLGGILGFYFLNIFAKVNPVAIAFTAGVFIYIACSDLIPEVHKDFKKQTRWLQSAAFLLGVISIYLIGTFIKH